MLRLPEIIATFIEVSKYGKEPQNYEFELFDFQRILTFFDFLFPLNSLVQLLIFT